MDYGESTAYARTGAPLLTLVVPIWNQDSGGILAAHVRDELYRLGRRLQVIVVDDHSEAPHFNALKSSFEALPNVVIARTERNSGPGAARNVGLDLVRSDWIAFADSDDEMNLRAYLELARLGQEDHRDVAAGSYEIAPHRDQPAKKSPAKDRPGSSIAESITRRAAVWRFVFRTEFLRKAGIRFPETRYAEDLIFMLQVADTSPRYRGYADVDLTTYRAPSPRRIETSADRANVQEAMSQLDHMTGTLRDPSLRTIVMTWKVRIAAFATFSGRPVGKGVVQTLRQLQPHSRSEFMDLVLAGWKLSCDLVGSPPLILSEGFGRSRRRRARGASTWR